MAFGIRKAIGKLKTVVSLNALNMDAAPSIPGVGFLQEVCGRIGRLFWISSKETKPCELVYGGILEQTQLWISIRSPGCVICS